MQVEQASTTDGLACKAGGTVVPVFAVYIIAVIVRYVPTSARQSPFRSGRG